MALTHPQDPYLFSGTIMENLLYGTDTEEPPTMEQIKAAVVAANAHDFIHDLPKCYYTEIGEPC